MGAVALKLAPVAFAFFGAALALLLTRTLSLRDAYESVEWPILILLGALIPVSEAVRTMVAIAQSTAAGATETTKEP